MGGVGEMGPQGPRRSPSYNPVGYLPSLVARLPNPARSDLHMEFDEGGTPLRPSGEAASSPAATAQQLLAEV